MKPNQRKVTAHNEHFRQWIIATPHRGNIIPCLTVLLLCVIVVACTNSKLVLRPFYNSLDNRIEDRFFKYADFNKEQRLDIQTLTDHFHVWHRQTQLPSYGIFLDEVAQKLDDPRTISTEDVSRWSGTIRESFAKIGSCSPIYSSAEILSGLSDEQLVTIQNRRADVLAERRADDGAQDKDSVDEGIDEGIEEGIEEGFADFASGRVKQINRYLLFIGVSLNKSQRADLSATMQATSSRTEGVRELIDQLDEEFFILLQQRRDDNWEAKLVEYVDNRRGQISSILATRREQSRPLWEAYALRTFQSLDTEQSTRTQSYLRGLAKTIRALANDTPSNTELDSGQYQCIGRSFS